MYSASLPISAAGGLCITSIWSRNCSQKCIWKPTNIPNIAKKYLASSNNWKILRVSAKMTLATNKFHSYNTSFNKLTKPEDAINISKSETINHSLFQVLGEAISYKNNGGLWLAEPWFALQAMFDYTFFGARYFWRYDRNIQRSCLKCNIRCWITPAFFLLFLRAVFVAVSPICAVNLFFWCNHCQNCFNLDDWFAAKWRNIEDDKYPN